MWELFFILLVSKREAELLTAEFVAPWHTHELWAAIGQRSPAVDDENVLTYTVIFTQPMRSCKCLLCFSRLKVGRMPFTQ